MRRCGAWRLIFVLIPLMSLGLSACGSHSRCADRQTQHPPAILYRLDELAAPRWWRESTAATPIDSSLRADAEAVIKREMGKFPTSVLGQLDQVVLVERLEARGVRIGAIYIGRGIVVAVDPGSTESRFHHEFASVLLEQCGKHLDVAAWHAVNPHGFEYLDSEWEAVSSGRSSLRGAPTWYMRGFLNEYASSTLSNDFAEMAGALFLGEQPIWTPAYAALGEKRKLAIAFYQRLDDSLSANYFYGLYSARMDAIGLDPYPPE